MVDRVEKGGAGLNLCYETRMGILNHTYGAPDDTREATVVRLSDRIAYLNHDLDDALRAGILTPADVPAEIRAVCGERTSARINAMISDLIANSREGTIRMSERMQEAFDLFHNFMYDAVYLNPAAKREESKVQGIVGGIYDYFVAHPQLLPPEFRLLAHEDGLEQAVCDYVAGMTDPYAVKIYSDIYIPASWRESR